MANCYNKRKLHKKKKGKRKEKGPKLSLGRMRVFFVGWLGDKRVSSLRSSLICLGSSLWAFGLW